MSTTTERESDRRVLAVGYAEMLTRYRPEHPFVVYNRFTVHRAGNLQWSYPTGGQLPGPQDYVNGWEIQSFPTFDSACAWTALHRLRRMCRSCFPLPGQRR